MILIIKFLSKITKFLSKIFSKEPIHTIDVGDDDLEGLIDQEEEPVNQQQCVVSQKVKRKNFSNLRILNWSLAPLPGRIYDYFKTRLDNNFIQLSA